MNICNNEIYLYICSLDTMKMNPKYNRITEVLQQQGRSQRWLAKQLSISANAMNSLCTQKSQSLERLFSIAEILGVFVVDLINVDYKPEKE